MFGGSTLAILVLVGVYSLSVAALPLTGQGTTQPMTVLAQVAVLLDPTILVFSLSTFGEEVGWRGFPQQALTDKGCVHTAAVVSAHCTASIPATGPNCCSC